MAASRRMQRASGASPLIPNGWSAAAKIARSRIEGGWLGRQIRKVLAATVASVVLMGWRLAAAQAATSAALELHYHLRLEHPSGHLVAVEIEVSKVDEPTLDFAIPAWSPGRYAIYDFAKNLQEFSATRADGHPLPWSQPDKETWRVDARSAGGTVRVRYFVFANDLNGSFSQYDTTHAN